VRKAGARGSRLTSACRLSELLHNIFYTRLAGAASMTSQGAVNDRLMHAGFFSGTSRDPSVSALMPGQDSTYPFAFSEGESRLACQKWPRGPSRSDGKRS
jgi:hypothetical protein